MAIVPVVISGGVGARLWPLSRASYPKPFIRLPDGQSLIQQSLIRAAAIPDVSEVVTITRRDLLFEVRDHYAELALPGLRHRFILEPEGRDTAAAIATAAVEIAAVMGERAVMCILPGDHVVADRAAFLDAVVRAVTMARQGRFVTLGIEPDRPETGYGYIEAAGADIVRFVEKPDAATAAEFLASGRFLWNSGICLCEAGVMLALMETHCPDILAACRLCLDQAHRTAANGLAQIELPAAGFPQVRATSLDYAVLEKASGLAVVPCDIGWADIGSWDAFAQLRRADAHGNRIDGIVATVDTRNSFVRGDSRLIAMVGVENLIVVDTADAVLIAAGDRTQDVRALYDLLQAEGHGSHREHPKVHRPWGIYTVMETGPGFKIKRMEVKPGGRLSLHMHHRRSEHWVVVAGRARVTNGTQEMLLGPDQSTYIPAGQRHRLENPDSDPLILIEVQTGGYLEEDDIVRFEDVEAR